MTGSLPAELAGRRYKACVEAFGWSDEYDPHCCRFPKSCSPYPHPEAIAAGNVTAADLEPARPDPVAEVATVPTVDEPRLELANIRRLCERHGIPPADGNGELRSTVAMVEEGLIRRPPVA